MHADRQVVAQARSTTTAALQATATVQQGQTPGGRAYLPRGDQAGTGPTIRMTDKAGVGNAGRA